jgi:peptide/nickel transport system permease protein
MATKKPAAIDRRHPRHDIYGVPRFLRRLAGALVLVWLVFTLTFVLLHAAPGDAADLLIPAGATPADVARLRSSLGLDQPLGVQYAQWVVRAASGNLGDSAALARPVGAIIADVLPASVALGLASLLLTYLAGVAVGFWQAARRGAADTVATLVTTAVYATPTFWLSLAAIATTTLGASALGLPAAWRLPAFGLRSPGLDLGGSEALLDVARHAVLPVLVLAAVGAAGVARYARASAIVLLGEPWMRTARAKGARPATVRWRHLLRNALPPLVTLFALALPGVVAGSVFVESVFGWPGMGRTLVQAISARDVPVVLGVTLAYAKVVILANLLADTMLTTLDPRRA